LKVGDRLSLERVTHEVKDPTTGKVLRRMSSQVGVIELTDVDDISSVGKVVSGSDFKVGDLAKTVAQ
jgi:hypothetical protein